MFIKRLKRLEKITPDMVRTSKITKLEQIMKEKKITTYQINKDTGLSYKTINAIINGANEKFQKSHLIILATYLNVCIADLFIREKLIND
ncbi:hypothetical protein FVAG_02917 [Fusobacterium varium ATCC 27725]|nr:hypothetical protein FVAG_02917 [Fusobacterium varium ATCC 27725]